MMVFCVIDATLESIKDIFYYSGQVYLADQQSLPAHHLETVSWYSILHFT